MKSERNGIMKKIICALLCAILLICAVSCKAPAQNEEDDADRFYFGGISMILPEGFSVTEAAGMKMAIYKDYPVHSDNITFSEGDGNISAYSEEALKQEIGSVLGELKDFKSEQKKVGDCDLVIASFGVEYLGVEMKETIYAYFIGAGSVAITFVSVSGEFDTAFEQTAASIKIVG